MNKANTKGTETQQTGTSQLQGAIGRYRWTICALLFLATTINYMDRSILGVLGPTLQYKVFNWTDQDYATINIAFKVAYAIGMLCMGAIIDRLGTKIGYTLSIAIWSVFGMLHAAVRPAFSLLGFSLARFGLGLGESGNFPAAIKTVGEWFPKKERAFATGIFNAGSNVGAILAPLVIPLIVSPDGTHWQYAFLTTGVFSALWVVAWLKFYGRPETHPRLSSAELAHINSDSVAETSRERVPWLKVLPLRETWAFSAAKITDAAWWFYLFWGGKFLYDRFGLNIKSVALPLITIYVLADGGSIAGGWLSSYFIKKGWPVNRARKTTLLICALCIMPVMFVTQVGTRFRVDQPFFDRLQASTYTREEVVTVGGKATVNKVEEPVPVEVHNALRALVRQRLWVRKGVRQRDWRRAHAGAGQTDGVGSYPMRPLGPVLLDRGAADRPCGRSPSGLVGQHLHPRLGCLPEEGHGVRHGHRRHGRCSGRHPGRLPTGPGAFLERACRLLLRFHACWFGIPGTPRRGASAHAENDPARREPAPRGELST